MAGRFPKQRPSLRFVQRFEQGLEQVAIVELVLMNLGDAGVCGARDFPVRASLAVDQAQGSGGGPQPVVGQEQQLGLGIGQRLDTGVITVHLVDEGLQVLVDFEALEGVGQQRWQGVAGHVELAQRRVFDAADVANLCQLQVAEALRLMAQTAHQLGAVPTQRLAQLTYPGALAIAVCRWAVGIGAGGMLEVMRMGAGSRPSA